VSDVGAPRHETYSEANGVLVQVDHEICAGFGDCVERAPEVFVLDDDRLAVILDADAVGRDVLREAAETCPVSAILIFDADGTRLAPELWDGKSPVDSS
jgi:ferredoxin